MSWEVALRWIIGGVAYINGRPLESRVGLTRKTLSKWSREGKFPRPVRLNDGNGVFWVESEVDAWLSALKRDREIPMLRRARPAAGAAVTPDEGAPPIAALAGD